MINAASAVQAIGQSVSQMNAVAVRMAAGPDAADLAGDVTKMVVAEKGVSIAAEIIKTRNEMLGSVIDLLA